MILSNGCAAQSQGGGSWPEIGVKLPRVPAPPILRVTALLIWSRCSVPHHFLAKVPSITQLFPNVTHLPLSRAMRGSQVSHCCLSLWYCNVIRAPGQGPVPHLPSCPRAWQTVNVQNAVNSANRCEHGLAWIRPFPTFSQVILLKTRRDFALILHELFNVLSTPRSPLLPSLVPPFPSTRSSPG